jgi:hypothetical protein
MSRKVFILCFLSFLLVNSSFVNARSAAIKNVDEKTKGHVYLVDDFELATEKDVVPEWWSFGDVKQSWVDNRVFIEEYLGKRSLRFTGSTDKWIVGGLGTYLGVKGTRFNAVKMVVYGGGKNSGMLSIELYDDDNENWEIELDPDASSRAYADDKFVYTLKVNWIGWKVVVIPFSQFHDDNPRIGDDVWNPNQKGRSGGLVQMQLLVLASKKKGKVRIGIDTIKFFKAPKSLLNSLKTEF